MRGVIAAKRPQSSCRGIVAVVSLSNSVVEEVEVGRKEEAVERDGE